MTLKDEIREKIESTLQANRVVLFMKGTPQAPQCGFSSKTVGMLDSVVPDYKSVNVLDDEEIREGIKLYGDWPTIPQLYVKKEFIGGCDIIKEMFEKGDLKKLFEDKKII